MGSERGRVACRIRNLVLAGLFLAGLWVGSGAAAPDEFASPFIRKITFSGNHSISGDRLRAGMRHRQPSPWNPLRRPRFLGRDVLAKDLLGILDLYHEEGFPFARILDALVEYEETDTHIRIGITLDEGRRVEVREILLEGVRPTLAPGVRKEIRLKKGGSLREDIVRRDIEQILIYYANRGMAMTEARSEVRYLADSLQADIVYQVQEGPVISIRDIRVEGEFGSRAGVIQRLVLLKPGDTFRRSRLLESQARLLRTGLFRSVRIIPLVDSTYVGQADLLVKISEKKPGWYGAGIGYSSDDEARIVAEWGHRNLRGRWRALQVTGSLKYSLDKTLGDTPLVLREGFAEMRFTEPFLFETPVASQSTLYHDFEREKTFEQTIDGVIQTFRRELTRKIRGKIDFEVRWVSTSDSTALREHYNTHLVTFTLDQDRRNSIFDPSQGSSYRFIADYAGGFLGGKNNFFRTTASASWYFTLSSGVVTAFRLKAGYIQPLGPELTGPGADSLQVARVPFEDRYRTGGGTTVRGYKEESLGRRTGEDQPIGGLALFIGNVEVRFPLVWQFQGALFMDAGNVWADPAEFKISRFREGFQHGPYSPLAVAFSLGFGLRFRTPVGPLRLDYGVMIGREPAEGESSREVHFSLGQAF
ncbi:MAG: BamA/TamA family outer membrane protein [Candidatus Eisenbacteria bacterium]|uniref:BamA/TamA family outer membrane protein n=1 Tax=Eiseniibacteriota bacterium TaxID=2212470 RepID=A0A948RVN5_UNCEI|nr:BamA/TamA family outer membrane protein [Candidatus Eisenbacteria bacterium]MBU1950992.1 BamA/TamA family outer membrane protein [Candidatus Eisenbacteria bacterium]MBU2690539.1 BamA/TamA family outer membrane protein [Candidatus Eisenbacteria bacterium]